MPPSAPASTITKRIKSDIPEIDFVISCTSSPIPADYEAETASGIPLTDRYAVERDADKGLVRLMNKGGRRVRHYIVPRHAIRAMVTVAYDTPRPDRVDLVFTQKTMNLVHTATSNAGVFTSSDVYELRYKGGPSLDLTPLTGRTDLLHRLKLGLSIYPPRKGSCRS